MEALLRDGEAGAEARGRTARAQRPSTSGLAAVTAVTALGAIGLLLGQAYRAYGTPASTAKAALDALSRGAVAELRDNEHLGLKARAREEVTSRGQQEFDRVRRLFDRASELGDSAYRKVHREVMDAGERAFRALPNDQQREVREKSRKDWYTRVGFQSLGDDEKKMIGGAPDVLNDKSKQEALAFEAGKATLSPDEQAKLQGKTPASPELATDNDLKHLVDKAVLAGKKGIDAVVSHVRHAADSEFHRLNWRERDKVEGQSFQQFVIDSGVKQLPPDRQALVSSPEAITDPRSDPARAMRRALGLALLDPGDRRDIESRDFDKFVAAHDQFVEQEGARLYAEFLKKTFAPGCCSVGESRAFGVSSKSLVRSLGALVDLKYAGPDPGKSPARDYLGEAVEVAYAKGTWSVDAWAAQGAGDWASRSRAVIQAPSGAAAIAAAVFVALIALAVVVSLALQRSANTIAFVEGVAAMAILACVQLAIEGQVSIDDLAFTPLYLAIPIWVGARSGPQSGFMSGFVTGVGLLCAATLVPAAQFASRAGSDLPFAEHVLAILFLALSGAAAGRVRWPRALVAILPVAWILFYVSIDRALVLSLNFAGHALLACAVVGAGLLLAQSGALAVVARVFQAEGAPATDDARP